MGTTLEHLRLLRELRGLLRWQGMQGITGYPVSAGLRIFLRTKGPSLPQRSSSRSETTAPPQAGSDSLQFFREELAGCRNCPLHAARLGLSSGRGSAGARLMFVGDWSRQGEGDFSPEVVLGVAEDAMVVRMTAAIQLPPEAIYLTNLLKCCPLPGQDPAPACVDCCLEHLSREISLVRPAVLCLLGGLPAATLLRQQAPLARLRGRRFKYQISAGSIPVMPTYHPNLLLRQPDFKAAVWSDLQAMQRWLME